VLDHVARANLVAVNFHEALQVEFG